MTKRCSKCGEMKDIGGFYYHPETKSKKHSYCKKCISEYYKNKYQLNKEFIKGRCKQWAKNNRIKVSNYYMSWLNKNRNNEKLRSSTWKRNNKNKCYKTSRIYHIENIIKIKGNTYNKKTSTTIELKPIIETLIMIRNKKKLYEGVRNGSG